jgi:hypothetical protein
MGKISFLFLLSSLFLFSYKPGYAAGKLAITGTRLKIEGSRILEPSGKEIRLRGENVTWWSRPTEKDAQMIKKMGFNNVRYLFHYEPPAGYKPGQFDPQYLPPIKEHIRLFTRLGLWVIVGEWKFSLEEDKVNIWNTPALRKDFYEMWKYVIGELKDENYIGAYEPMNEPHTESYGDDDDYLKWYRETIALIRSLDSKTPIVVGGNNFSNAIDLGPNVKMNDPSIIYTFHEYDPRDYTHIEYHVRNDLSWPKSFGTDYHDRDFGEVRKFAKQFDVPIWMGEFGVMTYAKGQKQFIQHIVTLAEKSNFHWNHWSWRHQTKESMELSYFEGDKVRYKTDMIKYMSGILKKAKAGKLSGTSKKTPKKSPKKQQTPVPAAK